MNTLFKVAMCACLVSGGCDESASVMDAAFSISVCGNSIVENDETCDDGNVSNTDDCLGTCVPAICGDGVRNVTSATPEACDDGNSTSGDGCSGDCSSNETCGNDVVDTGEACDDGNRESGDGCSSTCRSNEMCGNGVPDPNELCDDGPGGQCADNCQSSLGCGNGIIDLTASGAPIEQCDDGNTDNADGCSTSCRYARCGDGLVQTTFLHFENCDPGVDFVESAGCNTDCTSAVCGDGYVNKIAGEQCDRGSLNADDHDCTAQCKVNYCGDGHANTIGPNRIEQCDDGDTDNADGCNTICRTPMCGNGIKDLGEQCDDGNTANADGCRANCTYGN